MFRVFSLWNLLIATSEPAPSCSNAAGTVSVVSAATGLFIAADLLEGRVVLTQDETAALQMPLMKGFLGDYGCSGGDSWIDMTGVPILAGFLEATGVGLSSLRVMDTRDPSTPTTVTTFLRADGNLVGITADFDLFQALVASEQGPSYTVVVYPNMRLRGIANQFLRKLQMTGTA
ncbi:hypothetical protein CALCODRAFT_556753 [Calocera cornea HHB12733]|uniref:N-acetyltransferase domain-containing protein n=1 Tax=Calocera cornea HHB12733 TaxID=1353952 RepID=A0A165EG52_9BASI|nr:hypothetical protein CALCODRAFT_556753 [Calocera cornea HHB12733]